MVQIEVLYFEGCPSHEPTVALARSVVADLDMEVEIREVIVGSVDDAQSLRFLGSPSVRVNGRDIEPGADQRSSYALSCRLYDENGVPPREWLIAALEAA